jgi:hypothetical protein
VAGSPFTFRVKALEFDEHVVASAMDVKSAKALYWFGGYCLTTLRNSIRSAKGSSAPGAPPHSHVGTLKRLTQFAVEKAPTANVVIGALAIGGGLGGHTVPELLNEGGRITVTLNGRREAEKYRARPFTQPAFEIALKRAAKGWDEKVSGPLKA